MKTVVDQLPRLGKRELICLLLFTCNYVVFVRRGFLFFWVLGMGYVILLWHSLSLPYYFSSFEGGIWGFDCPSSWSMLACDLYLKCVIFTAVLIKVYYIGVSRIPRLSVKIGL